MRGLIRLVYKLTVVGLGNLKGRGKQAVRRGLDGVLGETAIPRGAREHGF